MPLNFIYFKNLHDHVSQGEINAIYTILRKYVKYSEKATLNTSKYGEFSIQDNILLITGALPTSRYMFHFPDLNIDFTGIIDENGDCSIVLSDVVGMDSLFELVIDFPQYIRYEYMEWVLSCNVSKTSLFVDESLIVSGSLLENGVGVAGETVEVYDGEVLVDSVVTDNSGGFSVSVGGLSVGEHSFMCVNANVSSDVVNVLVREHVYDLVLSCSTPIIQTGDSAIVTASLTRDGVAYSGETLTYTVKHGATTIDSGTVTTGSDGTATIPYAGTGVGDVEFIVEFGILLQKTYELVDAYYYRANPTACTDCNISLPPNAVISYRMSKPTLIDGSGGINLQFKDSTHTYFIGNWSSGGENGLIVRNTGSSTNLIRKTCSNMGANTEYLLGVSYNNGEWTVFKDDEVISFTANYTPLKIDIIQIQQGTIKDLIVKAL